MQLSSISSGGESSPSRIAAADSLAAGLQAGAGGAAAAAVATTAADGAAPGTALSDALSHVLLRETKAQPRLAVQAHKKAYEYDIGNSLSVLCSYTGTFWPLVKGKHEVYLYPLLHTVLVLVQWSWQQQVDDRMDRGTFWRTVFEVTADDDGVDARPKEYWEKSNMMIPWNAVGTLTPLMIFALVFFLSQCYSRFMTLFNACQLMETAIQEMTVHMLVHAKLHEDRWDAVRYLTAAAITTYGRALANEVENKRRCLNSMGLINWKRLLLPEADAEADYAQTWDGILGWPRAAGAVEVQHTEELHASFSTSATPPPWASSCPALLKADEVDELRRYPDSMVGLVLVTWCVQTLKELEVKNELKGPAFGQAQGSALKLRAASCKIYNLLRLPIPLPYFHTLVVLQNVCFAIMSWSLLSFVSFLTPIVLFFAVLVTVGLREVAVALSDPFGKDDVDFPIDTWIAQLRANALLVHRDNRVVQKPNRDNTPSRSNMDDEDELTKTWQKLFLLFTKKKQEEHEDEAVHGDGDGDGDEDV